MHTMVLQVLIAFGLCVVAESCFQLADCFDDCLCRPRSNGSSKPNHDVLSINVR
jgi:hypothetical protein